MSRLVKISERASMALHTMAYLSGNNGKKASAKSLAKVFGSSEAHLAKVLQGLVKSGLLISTRGPKGGFELVKKSDDISLLDVFEAVEGPLDDNKCLLGKPKCAETCILGSMIKNMDQYAKKCLSEKKLSELHNAFKKNDSEI